MPTRAGLGAAAICSATLRQCVRNSCRGHHLVEEPELEGTVGIEDLAAAHHLERPASTHQRRQALDCRPRPA